MRWLVIDCGTWLSGRKVLIHPSAIPRDDLEQQQFVVALTKAQVEDSPKLLEAQPVSQQMENQLYTYYGSHSAFVTSRIAGGARDRGLLPQVVRGQPLREECVFLPNEFHSGVRKLACMTCSSE